MTQRWLDVTPRLVLITDDDVDWNRVHRVWGDVAAALPPATVTLSVRTRRMDGAALVTLCRGLRRAAPHQPVVVSRRMDVAKAADVAGVHLPSRGLSARAAMDYLGSSSMVLRAAHDDEELQASAGAAGVLISPVFAPRSHAPDRGPLGLERLRELAEQRRWRLIALGGITAENVAQVAPWVWGVAVGARFFSDENPVRLAQALSSAVARLSPHRNRL